MAHGLPARNKLQRIEDLANNLAKDYSNLHLIVRGTPRFADTNLRGTTRFAKRQGNFLPVLSPNNNVELAESISVPPPTNKLKVSRVISGIMDVGTLISIGPGRELVQIDDIDEAAGEITTTEDMVGTHEAGSGIDIFGVPIDAIGNWSENSTSIQIRSQYPVFIGDQIAIDTTKGLLNSTVSTLITNVMFLGMALDGRYNYEIDLRQGISRSLLDEETIFLRSQPGYQSEAVSVSRVNGPFVVDYVSGPFYEDTTIDEYLSIQLLDSIGDPMAGYEDPVNVGKNFAVTSLPIKSQSMLFWDVIYGSVNFRNGKFLAITDDQGRFCLSCHLVPSFSPGVEWIIPVLANDTAQLRIKFEPNDFRSFSLASGVLQRVTVGMSSVEQAGTRIEVVVRSQNPGSIIEFNNWLPTVQVASVIYQITATAYGNNVWQASSLMLKPYFFTLEDIEARYDFSAYDNGVVHL